MRELVKHNVYASDAEANQGFLEDHPDSLSAGPIAIANAVLAVAEELRQLKETVARLGAVR